VQQFIGLLARVARTAGGGLVLVAHPSLTGISTGTGLSGTTQWHNAVRARMYLRGAGADVGEEPTGDLRMLEFKKNQYGPLSESVALRWDGNSGLFLPVGGADFAKAERAERARAVFLAILQRYARQNSKASDRTGGNYAPNLFAREREARDAGCTKEELKQAMLDLRAEGRIYDHESGRPSHRDHELRLRPEVGEQEPLPM
jgi:RecA-family ATPase